MLPVRDFHALGQRVLATTPSDGKRHRGIIEQFVEPGLSAPTVFKAKRFATLYSQAELERLCARQLPDGRQLGVGHVFQLLQVADTKTRLMLEKQAAAEGWSSRRLRTERLLLRGSRGKASQGGRKPSLPSSHQELLQQLEERSEKWMRWTRAILEASSSRPKALPGRRRKSTKLRVKGKLLSALTSLNVALKGLHEVLLERKLVRRERPGDKEAGG